MEFFKYESYWTFWFDYSFMRFIIISGKDGSFGVKKWVKQNLETGKIIKFKEMHESNKRIYCNNNVAVLY